MVFEGFGIDHLHAKLFPMHGTKGEWRKISSSVKTFNLLYEGYISSHDGPLAKNEDLQKIQKLLLLR